ncbi:hypothetical protein LPC08_02250 [Roseomonas sp. OT10]|uniref:helix-turn-helix transcriptional regulator n=1 Tax=Roseomonas cutis TaxID=2897332 RepID=UPI001E417C3F|nr:hypothetical protein [Roseomonas sp. OT10]UFN49488.1 hypothetical protein LPC08_02250 [Roseomonas sp. OT10]
MSAPLRSETDPALPEALALDLYAALAEDADLGVPLAALARSLGADTSVTFALMLDGPQVLRGERLAMMNIDQAAAPEYQAHWIHRDPRMEVIAALPPGVANLERILPGEAYARTPVWNEFTSRRIGSFHCMAATLEQQGEMRACFGAYRTRQREPFGPREESLLNAVYPHLRRVITARSRLTLPDSSLRMAIDTLPHGVAILSQDGRLLHANAQLQRMSELNDGFTLSQRGLYCAEAKPRRNLAHAIEATLAAAQGKVHLLIDAGTVAIPRPSGAAPWLVQAVPLLPRERLPSWLQAVGPAPFRGVMLLVTDAEARLGPSMALLRQMLGLSPAEAALASAMVRGISAKDFATRRGLSPGTLRGQLAALRAKTGCRRQADMVSLINRLIPP